MTEEERRIRLAQLAEERRRIEAQRQARMNMLELGSDYYNEQFDASLPPMLTGVNLAEQQNNGVQIDENGNPILPTQSSLIKPNQMPPEFPMQRPPLPDVSFLRPQLPNVNTPDVQDINPEQNNLAENATQFANNVINRRNNRISGSPNILDTVRSIQSYQNQNRLPVNQLAQNGPTVGSIDPRSPNQYMSAMEAAGGGQGQITDQMGLKPGGGVGLKSDLIDYAKDGSGDVLYNGQNTGVKADELNEAQQRLSGNYGSQDHYQKTFGNQEFLLALAIGLNSLSTFPNQQWGQFLQGQMQSIQKRKGAIDGANWLLSKGRRDLAEAVATGTLDFDKAYAEFTKKPEETFREFTAEEYKAIGHDPLTGGRIQVSNTSGRIIGGPYTKSTASVTNVNFPGEAGKERDKAFAKTYTENLEKLPDQMQQINTLKSVVDSLESGEVETGISKGLLPEWALALVDPKSLDARNQVASVVQRTLRETLGAQFTEREGENLLRRAWDLRQPTEVNIRNTRRLLETAMAFVEERTNQMQWFEDNGTLDGYKSDALNKLRSELVKMKNELVAPLPKDYDDQVGASGKGPKQFKKDGVAFTIEEVD